jgi:DNA-binding XRE family transcriptional regulator
MAMGKTLKERLDRLPAARRAKIEARADELFAEEMSLKDLRKARQMTQQRMAALLGIGQEGISRIEKRSDLLMSTVTASTTARALLHALREWLCSRCVSRVLPSAAAIPAA